MPTARSGPAGHHGGVTDSAERLRRRYPPPRTPRPVLIGLVAAVAALGMTWLIWAALSNANPTVSGQVLSYEVTSDTSIDITITVQRSDPSVPATCRVIAQSPDFQPVAEQEVPIEASTIELANLDLTLTTLRRATSASVSGCTSG